MQIKIYKTDVTEDYVLPKWMEGKVKRIFDVYYFDPTWKVYCCEMTPSYEMKYIECQYELDEIEDENLIDKIDMWFMENNNSEFYSYFHCNIIDGCETFQEGFFPENKSGVCCLDGFGDTFEENVYDEESDISKEEQHHNYIMEEMLEYVSCNEV